MSLRFPIIAFATLLSTGSQAAAPSDVTGLWVWHYPWTSAPAAIVKDSGPSWWASALVLNFCEDGRLRMATGVLYRGTGSAILAPSDLALYAGTWKLEGEAVVAQYRLVDTEIHFTGKDAAMNTELVERLPIKDGTLRFAFRYLGKESPRDLRLRRTNVGTRSVENRFVECGTDGGAPSNKSLERTRER
jgi:hypothetical protein